MLIIQPYLRPIIVAMALNPS